MNTYLETNYDCVAEFRDVVQYALFWHGHFLHVTNIVTP